MTKERAADTRRFPTTCTKSSSPEAECKCLAQSAPMVSYSDSACQTPFSTEPDRRRLKMNSATRKSGAMLTYSQGACQITLTSVCPSKSREDRVHYRCRTCNGRPQIIVIFNRDIHLLMPRASRSNAPSTTNFSEERMQQLLTSPRHPVPSPVSYPG